MKLVTDWLVTCRECRSNMVPHDQPDETCASCRDLIRQERQRLRGTCVICHTGRPWAGKVCLGCSMSRAAKESSRKRGWLWPLL